MRAATKIRVTTRSVADPRDGAAPVDMLPPSGLCEDPIVDRNRATVAYGTSGSVNVIHLWRLQLMCCLAFHDGCASGFSMTKQRCLRMAVLIVLTALLVGCRDAKAPTPNVPPPPAAVAPGPPSPP